MLEVESAVSWLLEASELTAQQQIHVYTEILLVKRNFEVILEQSWKCCSVQLLCLNRRLVTDCEHCSLPSWSEYEWRGELWETLGSLLDVWERRADGLPSIAPILEEARLPVLFLAAFVPRRSWLCPCAAAAGCRQGAGGSAAAERGNTRCMQCIVIHRIVHYNL